MIKLKIITSDFKDSFAEQVSDFISKHGIKQIEFKPIAMPLSNGGSKIMHIVYITYIKGDDDE